jgi:hypothetical protein
MRTMIAAAAAISVLVNIASANQPVVHVRCAPTTTEIRVFLNRLSVTHGNWRDLGSLIGPRWSFFVKSRSGTNLIGDISSPRGDASAERVSVPANEWICNSAIETKRAQHVR